MEFADLINEARASMDYTSPDGKTPADFLGALFNEFGSSGWSGKVDMKIRDQFKRGYELRKMLITLNMIEKLPKSRFKITQDGLDEVKKFNKIATDTEDADVAKGVKDIGVLKVKKFKVPKVGNNSNYLEQLKTILSHMKSFGRGTTKTTFMLAGDPGTGKTSFIKSLSTLTGVPLVIIEAPHITQEHLINIPFLVIDGARVEKGNLTVDDSDVKMKVVQAESNLITRLKQNRKRPKDKILRDINKNKVLRDIYPKLQKRLDKVSESYNSILFLDEFYRTSSTKIRNVLRNILNGKIGNSKIPKGVYIIMATNINDDGVDDIPLNQDFHLMDYDVSSKEDFMSFMYAKYIDNDADPDEDAEAKATIDMDVWNKFMDVLTDDDLGFNDEDADIRLSPRRLEQMIISLNALLPPGSEADVLQILAFIRNNLTNYLERTTNTELLNKFNQIAIELIKASNPEIDVEEALRTEIKDSEWREQLKTQIKLKLALGEDRTYVPIVSGAPGIGKTAEMRNASEEMEMGFIHIDVANLSTEDITGMPIADMSNGNDDITTTFSEPNLYISIMKEYNEQIDEVRQSDRKYNIILMFDELNRASIPVFNSIRKVLLEKEFDNVKLPDDIIITGAINPTDIGTMELTSHTRDVLDIIPSSGNFPNMIDYVTNMAGLKAIDKGLNFKLSIAIINIMSALALEFQSGEDGDGNDITDNNIKPFYWSDGASHFYVSPREMTECITNTVSQIEDTLDDMDYDPMTKYSDKEYGNFVTDMLNTTAKQFRNSFNMITLKQDVQDFTNALAMKITSNSRYRTFLNSIGDKHNQSISTIEEMLGRVDNIDALTADVIGTYIDAFTSTEFSQDIGALTDQYLADNSPIDSIYKITELTNKLLDSLKEADATNTFKDQLLKQILPKIAAILELKEVNLFDVADNEDLIQKLELLTKSHK